MSEQITKVPAIRFKGFTDPWEQRKLGDVLNERSILQPQSVEYPLVSFTVEKGVTQKTERYDREQLVSGDIEAKKYKITEYNDIVYNPANLKFGAIARNKYGKAVFSPIYVTFEVDVFLAFPEYVERLVTRSDFIQNSLRYQQGTVYERQSVSPEDLLSFSIPLPNIEEQKIIGVLFDNIDIAITLQQRELDLMKKEKQTLLSKMFPKTGEQFPEIRFNGFTDAWEQRKLKDMADFSKGNGYSKADLAKEGHPVILYGRLYTKYETIIEVVDTFAELKGKSVISKGGEVIVPASGESSEDISRASVVNIAGVALGGDLNIIKTNDELDSIFLALTISNGPQQKEMSKRSQGKSIVHLHNSDLKEVNLLFPKVEEQKKIGSFFKQIDLTITLQQRKLDQMKIMKKTLLKEMFV